MSEGGNGGANFATNPTRKDGAADGGPVDTLTLKLTRFPWHLQMEGNVENYDLAMAMLQQAVRAIEAKLRLEQLGQAQRQAADTALTAQIRKNLGRG